MKTKIDAKGNSVVLTIQKKLYPRELLQGAAYLLTDRATAYVEEKKGDYEVTLESKVMADAKQLKTLSQEFLDELLNQAVRQKLVQISQQKIRGSHQLDVEAGIKHV